MRCHGRCATFACTLIPALKSEFLRIAIEESLCQDLLLIASSSLVRWKIVVDVVRILKFFCKLALPHPKVEVLLIRDCDAEEFVWVGFD